MSETKRLCSPGAEENMLVSFPILDKGYIKLVDYLGCDNTVVAAARQSYDKGLKQDDYFGNEKLVNFLMRERHTSPFEQPAMVFEVKAPIMVFREWHRHRTGKLNEQSGRYAQLKREFYIPEPSRIQKQSTTNKQGSGESFDPEWSRQYIQQMARVCDYAFDFYEKSIAEGVAKELARLVLPVNTYSTMVFQCDAHNWMNFLRLRCSTTAQWEIRQYADKIYSVMQEAFPVVSAAFEEYVLKATLLSRSESRLLKEIILVNNMTSEPAMQLLKRLGNV